MADLIQFRRDTLERWQACNPVLAEGELGLVLGSAQQYKVGDGVHAWNDLPMKGFNGNILDCLGDSDDAVISQKGITALLKHIINSGSSVSVNNSWSALDDVVIPGIYIIIKDNLPMYHMLVSWDGEFNSYNQWIFGNLAIQPDGSVNGSVNDSTAIIHRSTKNIGETLTWGKWRNYQEYFLKEETGNNSQYSISQKFFTETINNLVQNLTALENRLANNLTHQLNQVNNQLTNANTRVDNLNLRFNEVENNVNKKVADLEAKIESIEGQLNNKSNE